MKNSARYILNTFFVCVTLGIVILFGSNIGKQDSHYFGDAMGYYMYLPCTFIYHNLEHPEVLPYKDSTIAPSALRCINQLNNSKKLSPKGIAFMQYTYGIALMELPYFLVAHGYEKTIGGHPNGYTASYSNAIWAGNFIYALLGLLLIYHILKRYFSSTIAIVTVCSIWAGTNLFWFSIYQYGMSHIPIFFLYSLLMLSTIKLHETAKIKWFILIGFTIGLIIVIRPTDIVCIFIPLFYNVYNKQTLKLKIDFIKANQLKMTLLIAAAILPVIPQLLYWKMISGKYFFYSYGEQTFNWLHPKIIEGLFYFSNGWLPYSLVMIFSLFGLILWKYYRQWAFSLFLIFPIYIYIIYSWFCYNYVNGMGSRPMIHMYPLLALPFAAFVSWISKKAIVYKTVFALAIVFMVSANYSFSMLKAKWLLDTETANFITCKQMLYKSKLTYEDIVASDLGVVQPDTSKLTKIALLGAQNFEDSSLDYPIIDPTNPGNRVYSMVNEEYMPCGISLKVNPSAFTDAKWLKISGRFYTVNWPDYPNRILVTEIKREDEMLKWYGCKIDNKIGMADHSCKHTEEQYTFNHFEHRLWGPVYYYVPVPGNMEAGDKINCYLWNPDKQEVLVDDLKLELYK